MIIIPANITIEDVVAFRRKHGLTLGEAWNALRALGKHGNVMVRS